MRIGDPLQQPKTEAEVAWLVRHAYPTQDEMNAAWAGLPSATEFDARDGISVGRAFAMIHPDDVARANRLCDALLEDGRPIEAVLRIIAIEPPTPRRPA